MRKFFSSLLFWFWQTRMKVVLTSCERIIMRLRILYSWIFSMCETFAMASTRRSAKITAQAEFTHTRRVRMSDSRGRSPFKNTSSCDKMRFPKKKVNGKNIFANAFCTINAHYIFQGESVLIICCFFHSKLGYNSKSEHLFIENNAIFLIDTCGICISPPLPADTLYCTATALLFYSTFLTSNDFVLERGNRKKIWFPFQLLDLIVSFRKSN